MPAVRSLRTFIAYRIVFLCMSETIGEAMDELEICQFLTERGLGVLGFAADGEAYTIPIAFAYDDEGERCILRLLVTEASQKREFIIVLIFQFLMFLAYYRPRAYRLERHPPSVSNLYPLYS